MTTTMTVGALKAYLAEALEDGFRILTDTQDTLAILDEEGPLAQIILEETADFGTQATISFIDDCAPGMAAYLAVTTEQVVDVLVDMESGFTSTKIVDRKELI